MERPLRLNFQVSSERIEILKQEKAFVELVEGKKKAKDIEEGQTLQQDILRVLATCDNTLYKNREKFMQMFDATFADLSLNAPLLKTIVGALSIQDETADICTNKKGNPEPDTSLRDTENVPLGEDVYAYFDREVKPYVADAWIDETSCDHKDKKVGIVGYEIPLTRYFYTYQPPRPLETIEGEIEEVENELLELLKGLTK